MRRDNLRRALRRPIERARENGEGLRRVESLRARRHAVRGADDLLTQLRRQRRTALHGRFDGCGHRISLVDPRVFRDAKLFPGVVLIGLVLAAVWHFAFLRVPPGADDDIHRYVWDGRLQRLGYNPYLVIPSDPSVKGLHTPETRTLNNPDLPSPYPPGAQVFFRAVTAIHESTFALKITFVVCELAIVLLLLDLLRCTGQATHLVLAFAWNPLLAIEVAGSGHIDIVGALLLVVSVAALVRRWRATAAVALGLAVAVKFLPIVLVPLYWKRVRIRDAALAAVVVGLLYVPFLSITAAFRSARWEHMCRVSALMVRCLLRSISRASTVPGRVGSACRIGDCNLAKNASASVWSPRCYLPGPWRHRFLCAPVVFPWYLLWLLPFLRRPRRCRSSSGR